MGKYDGVEFNDPIVRCTECQKILFRDELQHTGGCSCGCRKVRNVTALNEAEMKLLKNKKTDPEFIAMFAERAEV